MPAIFVADRLISTIFHETDPAWVISSEPHREAGLDWINDGQAFVVLSERGGWRQAYRCSRDGTEQTLLTPGEYDIIERVKVDEAGGFLYFAASPEDGTAQYLFRVPLDGPPGPPERITPCAKSATCLPSAVCLLSCLASV